MRTFHRVYHGRPRPASPARVEERLPIGQSIVVIAGLSALSWSVLILLAVAVSAVV